MKAFCALLTVSALSVLINADSVNWNEVKHVSDPLPRIPFNLVNNQKGPDARIVGGNEAVPNSIPYQVGLQLQLPNGNAWCGGSLISDQWVLTAAHCTDSAKSVVVYLGAHNIRNDSEATQIRVQVPGANLLVHEKWSPSTLTNDISLIKLPKKVSLNKNIQPVSLPTRSQENNNFENSEVIASGWGKDSDSATAVSPVLRYVRIPVIKKSTCSLYYLGSIQSTHICAGNNGKSSCNGDSGGPLVHEERNGSRTLVGATSFGIALGCEVGWPGVFTRITSYLDWISSKTGIPIRS